MKTSKSRIKSLIVSSFFCWSNTGNATCNSFQSMGVFFQLSRDSGAISVVGWEHLIDSEVEILKSALKQADQILADTGDCQESEQLLDQAIAKRASSFMQYDEVYPVVDQFVQDHPNSQIAIEMTERELESHLFEIETFDVGTASLQNSCTTDFQNKVQRILALLFGPEVMVSRNHSVVLIAAEDQEVKDQAARVFETEHLDTFDFDNPRFFFDNVLAIEQIRDLLMQEIYPSEEHLDRVVAFEPDLDLRRELKAELRFSVERGLEMIQGAYRRNAAIAERLLQDDLPKVMPIGWRHVHDLKLKLLERCELAP